MNMTEEVAFWFDAAAFYLRSGIVIGGTVDPLADFERCVSRAEKFIPSLPLSQRGPARALGRALYICAHDRLSDAYDAALRQYSKVIHVAA